jgi:regulator of sirC expression with transglutaminase-like and TPR domain
MADPVARFAALAARPDREIGLAEGALLIAAAGEYPGLDVAHWLARLDALADEAWPSLPEVGGDFERLQGLVEFLFERWGLRGNRESYYDPRNSYLNEVLERRLGIPITLAAVLIEVGRRLDVPLLGVGMPCHFLVCHARHPQLLLDPFDGGKLLTFEECGELLAAISRGRIRFRRELLRPSSARQMLFRILSNLRGIYAQCGRLERAVRMIDLQRLLVPQDRRLLRDRGLMLLRAGDLAGAEDLEAYLGTACDEPERERLAAILAQAKSRGGGVH